MKKLFTLLALSLFLFGCNDSDEKSEDPAGLVGKWEFLKITAEVSAADPAAKAEIIERLENDVDFMGDIEFTVDGRYGCYDPLDKKWDWGTYDFLNKALYVCFTDKEGTECDLTVYRLRGNNLTIFYDETEWMKGEHPNAKVTKAVQSIGYARR